MRWSTSRSATSARATWLAALPVPHLRGQAITIGRLYPDPGDTGLGWDAATGTLTVPLPQAPSACLLKLTH
jgi:hypothetical protein